MAVLLTGGAGYVGSHCAKLLRLAGEELLLLDDLRTGDRRLAQAPLIEAAIGAPGLLDRLFTENRIDAVMHFAAFAEVAESVREPAKYYRNNFSETETLIEAMIRHGVRVLVFSSTAATYGEPREIPIPETHPTVPVNPYGRSKRMAEQLLADCEAAYGLRAVSLRYFNASGADPDGEIGEIHQPESHLIPRIMESAFRGEPALPVYGTDYPTPDGTCIRDYVHVNDIAQAHILALRYLRDGGCGQIFNVGSQNGYSVLEMLGATERITGCPVPRQLHPRRPGDPARLIASSEKLRRELGWQPRYGLDDIIATAWRWRQKLGSSYRVRWE